MIPKSVLLDLPFDESIASYGYEDLVLALEAQKNGITVRHVDNPIRHLELHTRDKFLEKSKVAIDNLVALRNRGHNIDTNLEQFARKISRLGLARMFQWYYARREKAITANLLSDNPNLRKFDLYRLNYFLGVSK